MPTHAAQLYVVFRLDAQAYALPLRAVDEFVFMVELSRPPCAPPLLSGFFNFGGQPVAVVSLRQLFGLPANEPRLYTPLIMLKSRSPRVALEVDEVRGIIREACGNAIPIEDSFSLNRCATGVLKTNGDTTLVLEPQRLLLEAERRRVADLEQMERARLDALPEATLCQ